MMRFAVIGESCVDEYIYGTCDRVCPEAAALCFKNNGLKKTSFGMAANVVNNIRAIDNSVDIDLITNNYNSSLIIKRRFIDTKYNTIVFREDTNDSCQHIDLKKYDFSKYDCVIFSDYCKGFITDQDIIDICQRSNSNSYKFIDTKKTLGLFIEYMNFVKINSEEFNNNKHNIEYITNQTKLIVTKGDCGAELYDGDTIKHYPTKKINLRDVCGAGDTFLAGLVVKFMQTKDIDLSINYANECSSVVVSKFGVCTI